MLESLGSGDSSFTSDVSDNEHSSAGFFRKAHQARCTFADLTYTARRALQIAREDRLYRVYDKDRRRQLRRGCDDGLQQRLTENHHIVGVIAESLGAQLDLQRGFFTGDVERSVSRSLKSRGDLKKYCGFSNARLSADQDHRARHDSAAEDKIELRQTCLPTRFCGSRDVTETLRRSNLPAFTKRFRAGESSCGTAAG
jgi:hypothetical protein